MRSLAAVVLVVLAMAVVLGFLIAKYDEIAKENTRLEQAQANLAQCQELLETCDPEELAALREENAQLREELSEAQQQLDPFWQEQEKIRLRQEFEHKRIITYIGLGVFLGTLVLVSIAAGRWYTRN